MGTGRETRATIVAALAAAGLVLSACTADDPAPEAGEAGATSAAEAADRDHEPQPTSGLTEPTDPEAAGWTLLREETFDSDLGVDGVDWEVDPLTPDSKWAVDHLDDNSRYFEVKGGEAFGEHLDSFDLLRKRVTAGEDDWLTIELATRDYDGTGAGEDAPTVEVRDGAAHLIEPSWDGGIVITGTETLPEEYRIEYELKGVDFGGKRDGSWEYDGKYNGYAPGDCKTNFPWVREGDYDQDGEHDRCAEPFGDVTAENGYYFLAIMDYANPAPHNNIFIHNHRKVGMDSYSVDGSWAEKYKVCNPKTGELIDYPDSTANGINQIFFDGSAYREPDFGYNEFVMPTECGVRYGEDPDATIVATAEIQPELMPEETYTFAIERTTEGYATEMTGNFKYIGQATLRYERPFVAEDGRPIWHYNQSPEEYDGAFDKEMTFSGPHGEYTEHMWPADSAYPDNFVIGDPHVNFYEGSAVIDNLRLYTR